MVIRLQNVMSKWQLLPAGKVLLLPGEQPRRVRLEVNCEYDTRLDVYVPVGEAVDAKKDTGAFLATVSGYQVLEFSVPGAAYVIATSEGEVWYHTNDGEVPETHKGVETESFTKIMTRRARNPQLEMMMFKAEQNINRRLAAIEAEAAAWRQKYGTDPDTGEVIEDGNDGVSGGEPTAEGGANAGAAADAPAGEASVVAASAPAKTAKGAKPSAAA